MRLDAACRSRLEHFEDLCRRYETLRGQAIAEVDQAVSNAFQLAGLTKWIPQGLADPIMADEDFELDASSLGGDAVMAEDAAILVRPGISSSRFIQ